MSVSLSLSKNIFVKNCNVVIDVHSCPKEYYESMSSLMEEFCCRAQSLLQCHQEDSDDDKQDSYNILTV